MKRLLAPRTEVVIPTRGVSCIHKQSTGSKSQGEGGAESTKNQSAALLVLFEAIVNHSSVLS